MRPRISIRGSFRPSVRPSVRLEHVFFNEQIVGGKWSEMTRKTVPTRRKVFRIVPKWSKCPKMSKNVQKCPLQTHRCPNGLVSFFFPFLLLFFLLFPFYLRHFLSLPRLNDTARRSRMKIKKPSG